MVLMFSGCSCGFEGRIARKNCVTMESSRLISERAISIDSCNGLRSAGAKFFHLSLHQLQMDVKRVQRIADLMRDAGGEQSERVEPLRLDRLFSGAPRLGNVAQNHGVTDGFAEMASALLPIRRSIKSGTM